MLMLTSCPYCNTVFRIRAPELKAAYGQVQCGTCTALFNALESLRDEGLEAIPPGLLLESQSPAPKPLEHPQGPSIYNLEVITAELDMPVIPGSLDSPALIVPAKDEDLLVETFPFMLEPSEEGSSAHRVAETQGRPSQSLWAGGALVLVAGLVIQYAWFHGQELLARYPELRPLLDTVCVLFGCQIPARQDLQAVRLLSRDVRPHPRYRDALLVDATFMNAADFSQPYPVLQLKFSDTSGNLLAARRFEPAEYLDKSINIQQGMPPRLPVHAVLELQWLKQTLVSFEFKFL
jgi:predicted Zn finger-like uncharacterized protein